MRLAYLASQGAYFGFDRTLRTFWVIVRTYVSLAHLKVRSFTYLSLPECMPISASECWTPVSVQSLGFEAEAFFCIFICFFGFLYYFELCSRIGRIRRILKLNFELKFHDLRQRCAMALLDQERKLVAEKVNWKSLAMVDLYTTF